MSRPDPIRRGLLAICLGLVLGGCAAPAYYWQAIEGQLELWQRSRPIAALTLDPEITPAIKGKLATVLRIRDFASQELVLPSNGSYRKYADIRRSYVVWNVFAAEEFSVTTKQWCFPVAGCVSYRGYFSEESARAYAAQLRDEGYDVHVGGVPAYSTLGWFDDPVLNTFIHYPETELARLIFHELAHQVAYVQDDSEFNESFAVAVELEGIQRWLSRFGNDAQRASFEVMQRYRSDFYALVLKYRERLAQAYAVQATVQAKREHKARILGELQEEYRMIKSERWGGFSGFDRWFGQSINNATLASVGIYHQLVPAFQALLTNNGDDLGRFYEAVRDLASDAKPERQRRLAHALEQGRRSKLATGEPNGESLGLGSR